MTVLLALGAVALAAWWVSLLRHPSRPCSKCEGRGTNPGSNAERWGRCTRCGGSKQVRRFGATAAKAILWGALGQEARKRRQKQMTRRRERGGYPE